MLRSWYNLIDLAVLQYTDYFRELFLYLTLVKILNMTISVVSLTVCTAANLLSSRVFKKEFWFRCLSPACWSFASHTLSFHYSVLSSLFNKAISPCENRYPGSAVKQLQVFIGPPATFLHALSQVINCQFHIGAFFCRLGIMHKLRSCQCQWQTFLNQHIKFHKTFLRIAVWSRN